MKIRLIFTMLASCILGSGASAFSQTVCGTWDHVPSPLNGQEENRLRSISAVSANDIWAIGFYDASIGSLFIPRATTMHWNGANWSVVPSPIVGVSGDFLFGVTAISANDVWAVGFSSTFGEAQTLTMHWNGSSWNVVPSPVYTGGSALWAVAAVSANEVWAVGERVVGDPGPTGGTLTLRWDGSEWEEVPSPNPPGPAENNSLYAIGIVSENDIWAVGEHDVPGNFKQAMILHWDGSGWMIVPNPHSNSEWDKGIVAVAGAASNDVWTSGVIQTFNGVEPLFMHWDGSSWSVVSSPGGVAPYFGGRSGLVSISPNDVWAVGRTIAHWDGSSWDLVDFPVPGIDAELHAVAKVSSCDLWGAGDFYDGNTSATLFEHLTAGSNNQPPVVSDIPDQAVLLGGRFAPLRMDNYVTDPDNSDPEIVWNWSGNSVLRVILDPTRRKIRIRAPGTWTGHETIVFTATDPSGQTDSDAATFTVTAAQAVAKQENGFEEDIPDVTSLLGNYPNPFNPSTTIRYELDAKGAVSLRMYSVIGEEVATLVDEVKEEGYHEVIFDAGNLASGTYFYRLVAGDVVAVRKLVVMK